MTVTFRILILPMMNLNRNTIKLVKEWNMMLTVVEVERSKAISTQTQKRLSFVFIVTFMLVC